MALHTTRFSPATMGLRCRKISNLCQIPGSRALNSGMTGSRLGFGINHLACFRFSRG